MALAKWLFLMMGLFCLILLLRDMKARAVLTFFVLLTIAAWLVVKFGRNSVFQELMFKMVPYLVPPLYAAAGVGYLGQLRDLLNQWANLSGITTVLDEKAVVIGFFILLCAVFSLWENRDHTTLGKNKEKIDPMLREKSVAEKRLAFRDELFQRLKKINQDMDWNAGYYAPIEAEVEASTGNHHRRRYPDLLRCLKKNRHNGKVYLVLGEPGSGKSVSLRKLCMDLLEEVESSNKIPVYINLKEWTEPWTMNNKPTPQDLAVFIRQTLRQGTDLFSDSFVDDYFEPMLRNGWWYFIFDSFDEMPCLMGRENCGELIAHISNLLSDFLTAPGQSGGIIASRLNKAPTEALRTDSTLFLREFDDWRIGIMLDKYLNHGREVAKKLFDGTQEHLVALCRNPFSLTLLINYIRENGVEFPETQMELYENFMSERLSHCKDRLEIAGLSAEEVRDAARELADMMQEGETLEYPISRLIPAEGWRTILDILKYARICRFSEQQDVVSFVHRRFQEFLLVERMIAGQRKIRMEEYEGIATGSGIRDALVLYCEIADCEKAKEIAQYCWGIVQKNIENRGYIGNSGCLELTNTLYFMTEAFRSRPDAVGEFRAGFEKLAKLCLNPWSYKETDSMVSLAVANSMSLFDEVYAQQIILYVFWMENRWLRNTVMKNCRSIRKLHREIEKEFIKHYESMPPLEFLRRFRDVRFSMLYVPAFHYIRMKHLLRGVFYLSLLLLPVCAVFYFVFVYCPSFPRLYLPFKAREWTGYIVGTGFVSWGLYSFGRLFDFDTVGESSGGVGLLRKFASFLLIIVIGVVFTFNSPHLPLPIPVFSGAFGITCAVLFLPTVIRYASVILRGVFEIIRFLICVWENPKEKAIAWCVMGIIVLLGHFAPDPFSNSDITSRAPETLEIVLMFIIACCLLSPLLIYCIYQFLDLYWVKHQPDVKAINRAILSENLEHLHTKKGRRAYVEFLLDNKTKLTGDWPSGVRPTWDREKPIKFGFFLIRDSVLNFDDVLDYNLAKLESLDPKLKTYHYSF